MELPQPGILPGEGRNTMSVWEASIHQIPPRTAVVGGRVAILRCCPRSLELQDWVLVSLVELVDNRLTNLANYFVA